MANKSQPQDYDIIIVGGGMVGLLTAITLHEAIPPRLDGKGLSILLIEKEKPFAHIQDDYDGRSSAISYASQNLLNHLGIWQDLDGYASAIRHIRIADGDIKTHKDSMVDMGDKDHISPFTLDFMVDQTNAKRGEAYGSIIENQKIRLSLEAKIKGLVGITRLHEKIVKEIELPQNHLASAKLILSDGTLYTTKLIVAADGKFSKLRDMANISHKFIDYHHDALVTTVKHEKSHNGVAVELFLPAGPFAMLPMTEKRMSIVWPESRAMAHEIAQYDDKRFLNELHKRFGDWLGEIEITGPRHSFPLSMVLVEEMIRPRFALIGDAAHAIHPIAGQGYNMGVRDIAALGEVLKNARYRGLDIGDIAVLKEYQTWRRFDNHSLSLICHGLLKLFSNQDPILTPIRRMGLSWVDQVPSLKTFFTTHAMGLFGERPPLLK